MGVEAILLSAGESSRMGQPKALLDWFGVPLVKAQIDALFHGGVDRVVVVTGAHHHEIADRIVSDAKVAVVSNPRWAEGKTTSIKAGLAAIGDACETIVLLAVDQPRPGWVVNCSLKSHLSSGRPVTSPRYGGHGGHPLIFDASLFRDLANLSEEREGVREIMKRHEDSMNRVYFDNRIVRFDLNTPEDYEDALTTYPSLSKRM